MSFVVLVYFLWIFSLLVFFLVFLCFFLFSWFLWSFVFLVIFLSVFCVLVSISFSFSCLLAIYWLCSLFFFRSFRVIVNFLGISSLRRFWRILVSSVFWHFG